MKKTSAIGDGAQSAAQAPRQFPPLETIVRPTVPTEWAAHYLNFQSQTLRLWASRGTGPIRPIRINRRLAWPVSELKRVLGVGE